MNLWLWINSFARPGLSSACQLFDGSYCIQTQWDVYSCLPGHGSARHSGVCVAVYLALADSGVCIAVYLVMADSGMCIAVYLAMAQPDTMGCV